MEWEAFLDLALDDRIMMRDAFEGLIEASEGEPPTKPKDLRR